MKIKAVSGMMLRLLLSCMLTLTFVVQPAKAEPTTIIVPDDYPTIQGAINAARSGDTIVVREGLYAEGEIAVNKPLTLIAEGTVVVDGLRTASCVFCVSASRVVIRGFTVRNALYYGIFLSDVAYCKIEGNTVSDSHIGIEVMWSAYNNIVKDNTVFNNTYGISVFNLPVGSPDYSEYNILEGNIVRNSSYGISIFWSDYNIIRGNTVTDNYLGLIVAYDSDCNTISENTVANNGLGIGFLDSNYNLIQENEATNNFDGILLGGYSRCNMVKGNTANRNSRYGIGMQLCHSNIIKENKAFQNEEFDLYWDGRGGGHVWAENRYKTKTDNIMQEK